MRKAIWLLNGIFSVGTLLAQQPNSYYITADRVFDGETLHTGWAVLVDGDKISAVGPTSQLKPPAGAIRIQAGNSTLLPGLIEGHSHILLYPYNITDWDTQVLKESDTYRTARATTHLKKTLMAGFTTERDLGTEGAGYADVALKRAVNEGLIPGPRLLVAGRAIVATGSYGPKGYDPDSKIMLGAEEADGSDLVRVTRDQMGKGADIIKVYADYRWGPGSENLPTFSLEELNLVRETANSGGRPLVVHASTKEGMRRAILAGAETVEHGDELDEEIAKLMVAHQVTWIPTLAATESISRYRGWVKGKSPEPANITQKKKAFQAALAAKVNIGMGGDVGVFAHGENVLEMELMVEYGMKAIDVLKAATSINARAFHLEGLTGSIKTGLKADLLIVEGNPAQQIADCRNVKWVMKDGVVYRNEF
ncbi:amidohydrolase family protein [Flavihumibacter profundi]|jgi:imidazolonepropionase-like amidohydrolase|uniref:amidohydrolase family protein n=1 Tax=Flavihumibacter profundi TaxID=2716883 RepID=UPI001CC52A20|nr:amidohydrolase family protein [Flavihumibacter profundi]MBZ5857659.1 amidohydrolase family protein [Flavihumibacter profundi]